MIKKSILIVDDELDTRKLVRLVLEPEGYSVDEAEDGDACLRIVSKKMYDLILLDIMMPGTPADEVVKRLRRVKSASKTKISYFTVVEKKKEEINEILKQPNVVDYILKPVSNDELVARVNRVLG